MAECTEFQVKVDRPPTNTHWGRIDPRTGADQRAEAGVGKSTALPYRVSQVKRAVLPYRIPEAKPLPQKYRGFLVPQLLR